MYTTSYGHLNMIHCGGKYLKKRDALSLQKIHWLNSRVSMITQYYHHHSLYNHRPISRKLEPSGRWKCHQTWKKYMIVQTTAMNFLMTRKKILSILTTSILLGEGWKHFITTASSQVSTPFNTSLNECKVQFDDGSTNHIQPGDIDNTDRIREDRWFCLFWFLI